MRTKIIITFLLLFSIRMTAQEQGHVSLHADAVYGTDVKGPGVGGSVLYGFTEHLRGSIGYRYFFKKNAMRMHNLAFDVQWLIPLESQFSVYPVVGLVLTNVRYDGKLPQRQDGGSMKAVETETKLGGMIGFGAEYMLSEHIGIHLQGGYQMVKTYGQGVFDIGIGYRF